MHKPLVFPCESFSDLFERWAPYTKEVPSWAKPIKVTGPCIGKALKGKRKRNGEPDLNSHMFFDSYCIVRDRESLRVKPKQEVIDTIMRNTIIVEYDKMFWEICPHDNGKSLVVCSHNLILGNVWVALIDTETVPQ
jgi:hypothetical protein